MTNDERFREKLKILNEEFVDFVSAALQDNPSYDLTPSVTDYLTHVKYLDQMYAEFPQKRKIVCAKRKRSAEEKPINEDKLSKTSKDREKSDSDVDSPPKAKLVKHNEPNDAFSTNCSILVNPDLKKAGDGFLHKAPSATQAQEKCNAGDSSHHNVKFSKKPEFSVKSSHNNSSLFGGLIKPGASSPFTWNPSTVANSTTTGQSPTATNEKSESDSPPRVELVKHEEPDAVFSTKCSLFNFIDHEYKKVGVGFLHIKKSESGTQLLIRAANALGTVLVNTYIKDTFKAEKKAKDKIQFSYPNSEGPKTHLVRMIEKFEDALAYLTGEKKP